LDFTRSWVSDCQSRGKSFNFIKKVHVRPVRNTAPPHHLSQIIGLDKLAHPLQIIPLHQVLDHLIIGQQRYVSLKERGLGFK